MEEKINCLLDDVNGFPLDELQRSVVTCDLKHVLVSAGAGSGKSLTIIGKIRYLIEILGLKEEEIICISFTNEATLSLKNKLSSNYGYDVPCYTFHKLGLEILKDFNYKISDTGLLMYIINEFFNGFIDDENKKRVLVYFGIMYNEFNFRKKYSAIDEDSFREFKELIFKFINLFKANDYLPSDFVSFLRVEKNYRRKAFLIITYYVYYFYQNELSSRNEIDFSDMISRATEVVLERGFNRCVRYIIIDEFQDTSLVRFNLIRALLSSSGASLLVVGDDFQSIYRFTGCDLDLFLNFNGMYKDSKILKILNTYRNSQELIDIAGGFVMKNKNQLVKELKSSKRCDFPLRIVYYRNFIKSFILLIEHIYTSTGKSILVLGRNNFDVNVLLNTNMFFMNGTSLIYKDNPDIKMTYLTVHRSKGLEDEYVIVINMRDDKLGFPNKIKDNVVLRHVSCKGDDYLYAEERRLFYVAITRTKNIAYLMTSSDSESIFISEIKRDYRGKIKIVRNNKF